jgi:hypothetical protein
MLNWKWIAFLKGFYRKSSYSILFLAGTFLKLET